MTISIEQTVEGVQGLREALGRLQALGEVPRPIWEAIANAGETSTRLRFKSQAGPDGARWTPSKRAQKTGGQTLVLKARLLRSITHRATNSGAEWGSNVIYAGIHQFGGKINKLAFSSWLRLRTGKGGALLRQKDHANLSVFAKATHKNAVTKRYTVGAHAITMPARPYLGVNEQDGQEFVRLVEQLIDQAGRNREGA